MKEVFVFFLIMTFSLSACMERKADINQLWFYSYSSDSSLQTNTLSPANFIELRTDGSFTSDLGKFQSGHWRLIDQQLFLTSGSGPEDVILVNSIQGNEMVLKTKYSGLANFDGLVLPKKEKDPFSQPNNIWRYPATSHESDEQIMTRLRNHCHFWTTYFTWALDENLTTVDVRSTPSPIKIYGNGFAIKPFEELPATWKNYFYDSSDCRKATVLLDSIVKHNTIAWAHTDSKYKMFISAFQQMERLLH